MRYLALAAILAALVTGFSFGEQYRLEMAALDRWEPETFPWASRHSTYRPERIDGANVIRIQSCESVSGLEYRQVFDTGRTPVVEWSWKAMNVLANGNAESKGGDDYPVRVYVKFPYEEEGLSLSLRLQYDVMKVILGHYPPSAVLNYVWANRPHRQNPIRNAFSNRAVMFFTDSGSEHLGRWRSHRVNIIDDFREAFHRDPPDSFTIAIMGDSINTGGCTDAYIRDIRVSSVDVQ